MLRLTKLISLKQPVLLFSMLMIGMQPSYSQSSRDYISIAGSSTVYPFVAAVADHFGKMTSFKAPKIESTGTGGGFKLFCSGTGVNTTDMATASRAIKPSELELCQQNKVTEIAEIKLGYDGIVLARSNQAPPMKLTRVQLFQALAKKVENAQGQLVANPYQTWQEIDPSLPAIKIEVLGPPPTSGTRDAFVELVMDVGCHAFPAIQALQKSNPEEYKVVCQGMREDGAFIEAGENDNLIVQKLVANVNAFGIFGFSFLEENRDKVQGVVIDQIMPSFETIASHEYAVSRPLFVYVKLAHLKVIPGIQEFINALVSEEAIGHDGYLLDRGLIPMAEEERTRYVEKLQHQLQK